MRRYLVIFFLMSFVMSSMCTQYMIDKNIARTALTTADGTSVTTEHEQLITGLCTFGDCPVATTLMDASAADKSYGPSGQPTETTTEYADAKHVDTSPSEEDTVSYQDDAEDESPEYEYAYNSSAVYSPSYFKTMGLIDWGGWTWSWYSEYVLPGAGLNIPGRHSSGGYVRDSDGYICLASDVLDYGTVIATPFGSYGKVYDCGVGHDDWIDVYVSW